MKKEKDIKNKKAVALSYDAEYDAPKVIAKGEGIIAQNIIDKGKKEDVVIYEDKKLVDSLIKLELNTEIPQELYDVVAEVIFFVYTLDKTKEDEYGQ